MPAGIYKRKPVTEKTKKILSKSHKGKTLKEMGYTPETCRCFICKGKRGEAWNKNIHLSEKHKENLSISGKRRLDVKGKNSHWWKGGIMDLSCAIKTLNEFKQWRKQIYERDNYICQECFIEGNNKNLESHHIKAFSIILKEFLQIYSQFSPIEDKETLIRLAITYSKFWDINNGETLCKECHKLTDNYGNKTGINQYTNI